MDTEKELPSLSIRGTPRRCIMRSLRIVVIVMLLFVAEGCGGRVNYIPPSGAIPQERSTYINASKDQVWKKIIPALSNSFFVINNLDKDSGLINVSYSGDPEKYVDCGYVESYVKNFRGERKYFFPASKAHQIYEVMDTKRGALYRVDRKMNLDGRINIVIEEVGPERCKLSVNVKYVLTRSSTIRSSNGPVDNLSDAISFTSGQKAQFPVGGGRGGTQCQPTGKLEKEILEILTASF